MSASLWTNAWTVRLNADGNLIWQHAFNIGLHTYIADIQNTTDGGLIVAGAVASNAPSDLLVMKLAPDALTAPQLELLPPTGAPGQLILRGIAGRTYVTEGTEDFLSWLPFATNTLSSNSVELLDRMPAPEKRFYRAMMLP